MRGVGGNFLGGGGWGRVFGGWGHMVGGLKWADRKSKKGLRNKPGKCKRQTFEYHSQCWIRKNPSDSGIFIV